ncbi:MAG: Wzy polymerase domain-containing protein [Rhodocyclaceae bacterium]
MDLSVSSARSPYRLALGLLALFVALATLASVHRYPQTVFLNEWLATLWVVVFGGIVVAWPGRATIRLSGALAALTLLIACFAISGLAAAPGIATSFVLYGALAMLTLVLIQHARSRTGEGLAQWLAGGFLLAALVQTVISVAQLAGWSWHGFVMPKLLNSTYGNIAQPNHYGNLLWLGMVSGLYLWLRGRLPAWLAVLFAADLAVFSALSASRAVLLYTAGLPLLALLFWYRADAVERRRVWAAVAVITLLSCAAQAWVAFGGARDLLGVASSIGRLDDAGSNTQRLFDWMVALRTAWAHPLAGTGIGSFAWQTGLHSIGLPPARFVRIGENAHDTPLHLAAELGPVATLIIVGCFGLWLVRRLRERAVAENFWALGLLGVLGAHSLVEYPLWYAYFIVPLGLAIGVLDGRDDSLATFEVPRWALALPLCLAVGVLGWTWRDYQALERGYALINDDTPLTHAEREEVYRLAGTVSPYSMFATHAGILKLRAWPAGDVADSRGMAALCDTAARAKPSYTVLEKCVSAYAIQQHRARATLMVDVICGAYPEPVRRALPAIVREAWQHNGWPVPRRAGCV